MRSNLQIYFYVVSEAKGKPKWAKISEEHIHTSWICFPRLCSPTCAALHGTVMWSSLEPHRRPTVGRVGRRSVTGGSHTTRPQLKKHHTGWNLRKIIGQITWHLNACSCAYCVPTLLLPECNEFSLARITITVMIHYTDCIQLKKKTSFLKKIYSCKLSAFLSKWISCIWAWNLVQMQKKKEREEPKFYNFEINFLYFNY